MSEVFGTPMQQEMQRRALALWTLLKGDRRFLCHGRLLSVSFETPDCVDLVMSLAHLQGSAGFENVPRDAVKLVQRPLHNAGLVTDIGEEWVAGSDALRASDRAIAANPIPAGLSLRRIDKDTSTKMIHALASLALRSGEWLPMEEFLRGNGRPSVFLYITDADDNPVAMAGSVIHAARLHPREEEGWWGMLSVDANHRQKGLSLMLAAQVMRRMRIDYGTEQFRTIIRPGQDGYRAMCQQLGFSSAHQSAIFVQDPTGLAAAG